MLFRVVMAACVGQSVWGFSTSAPSAWLAQGATGVVGALACLLALRARELDRAKLATLGGRPLYAMGALATVGLGLGVVELFLAGGFRYSTALAAGPVAIVAAVLLAVSALRLSTAHPSRRVLQATAVLALVTAAATTALYVRSLTLVRPLPGVQQHRVG